MRDSNVNIIMDIKLIVVLALLLSGCSPNSSDTDSLVIQHDGSDMAVSFPVPKALNRELVGDLRAQASIDGKTTELDVNPDNTVSGEIHDVKTGTHQLFITYFVLESGLQVNLAVATKDVNVVANNITTVTLSDTDLNRNFDDDLDGYTNLAEIRIGTLALDKFDSPGGESPLYVVSNGSFGQTQSTSYNIKSVLGDSVSDINLSTNYVFKSGYSNF